ncbi:MAG: S1 RNA-binding domain-containing protein, partial [Rhodoferax sp.]|nr:S1 RNA-binding domain-containing protein [Rhodoferax sp.]
AGLHCSANERRADEASRDVEAWLKCKFMREHLGEEFGGVVTSVTSFGLFVTLDAMYVEGLVHITELGGEYFRFDEARQELRGERTGTRYAIGTRVCIQVSRVDLDGRRIDFRRVNENDALNSRMADKTGMHEGKGRTFLADSLDADVEGSVPVFKTKSRKQGTAKTGRAEKPSSTKSAARATVASKKAARKKR